MKQNFILITQKSEEIMSHSHLLMLLLSRFCAAAAAGSDLLTPSLHKHPSCRLVLQSAGRIKTQKRSHRLCVCCLRYSCVVKREACT